MIVTKAAIVVGLLFLGLLCYLTAVGSAAATGLLVTAVALVVLVGGGNWISGRRPGAPGRTGGAPARTPSQPDGQTAGSVGADESPGSGAAPDAGDAGEPGMTNEPAGPVRPGVAEH